MALFRGNSISHKRQNTVGEGSMSGEERQELYDIVWGYVDSRFSLPVNKGDILRQIDSILEQIEELAVEIEQGNYSPTLDDLKEDEGDRKYHAKANGD